MRPGALPSAPEAPAGDALRAAARPTRRSRLAWGLAGGALVLVLAKSFVGDLYAIQSGSMRPTLFGGAAEDGGRPFREHVLVLYGRDLHPERFDLVVLRAADGGAPLVKRVVGLPGETLAIADGDLLVDGKRLPPEARRPEPIPVFDDRLLDLREAFDLELAPAGPWTREGEAWCVDARAVPPGSRAGTMQLRRGMHDDYLDQDGRLVRGARPVNDLVLACELSLEPPAEGASLARLSLVEEGDTFVAALAPRAETLEVTLSRYNARTLAEADPARKSEVLAQAELPLAPGWLAVRFANVDNALTLELDGRVVARAVYEANEEAPAFPGPGTAARGARVSLGAEGLRARFRRVRVARDLYYTASGSFACVEPVRLGLEEYFLLGDNSAASTDSRSFGPVPRARLLGRPVGVPWPPGRVRLLGGAR